MVRIRHILLALGLILAVPASVLSAPAALQNLPVGAPQTLGTAGEGALYKADIFRDCQNIEGRWRCRTCQFVRRCGREGCFWEEQCRWGPPVSPLPQ